MNTLKNNIQKIEYFLNEQHDKAFENVVTIPKPYVHKIYREYIKKVVKPCNLFVLDTLTGLGSTRNFLEKNPYTKPYAGDIDLLVISKDEDSKNTSKRFLEWLNTNGFEARLFFGNIVACAFPFTVQRTGKTYKAQIDLMICEDSPEDKVYTYMKNLRFYADEAYYGDITDWMDEEEEPQTLKGTHRTELLRSLGYSFGLSMAEKTIGIFRWNNSVKTLDELTGAIQQTIKKSRRQENIDALTNLSNFITSNYQTLEEFKKAMVDKDNYVITRLSLIPKNITPIHGSSTDGVNYVDMFGINWLHKKCFDMIPVTDVSWEEILKHYFDIDGDILEQISKFSDVLKLIKKLHTSKKITTFTLKNIFKNYRERLEAKPKDGLWKTKLSDSIVSVFPELKGIL